MAIIKGPIFFNCNVEFEDIRFVRATPMNKGEEIELTITILRGTGQFSITEGSATVVIGIIREVEKPYPLTQLPPLPESVYPNLQSQDFYKELRLRGYHYEGAFQSVQVARGDGLYARIKWDGNWIPFLDCLLQVQILAKDSRALILPTRIQKLRINAKDHMKMTSQLDSQNPFFEVNVCKTLGILVSGGIEIFGVHTSPVTRRKFPGILVLESYKFITHFPSPLLRKSDAVRACVQLALENNPMLKIKVVEVDNHCGTPIIDEFQKALEATPIVTADFMLLTKQNIDLKNIHIEDGQLKSQSNCYFVIMHHRLSHLALVENSLSSLRDNGYLVSRELHNVDHTLNSPLPDGFQLLAVFRYDEESLLLYRKIKKRILEIPNVVFVNLNDYEWLNVLRSSIKEAPVILVAQKVETSGILGFVNCIRKESLDNPLTCVFIDDSRAPPFDTSDPFYSRQLNLGLAINVYRDVNGFYFLSL